MVQFSTLIDPLNATLTPDGGNPLVLGINDNGVLFGLYWNNKLNTQSQFLYKSGGFTLLNVPFTIPGSTSTIYSQINDMNSSGEVVGNYFQNVGVGGVAVTHGFVYLNNEYFKLDHPLASTTAVYTIPAKGQYPSFSFSGTTVSAVNNTGQIVGNYIDSNAKLHGYYYNDYNFTTIDGPLGTGANISDINNRGQIIGSYQTSDNKSHGFIYTNGQYQILDAPNADSSGTTLQHINDSGAIIGSYFDSTGNKQDFYYNSGNYTSITLPSEALIYGAELNNKGQIAGSYLTGDITKDTVVVHNFFTQVYDISSVSQSAAADNVYLLYQASFARLPDESGFKFWSGKAAVEKLTALQLADAFMTTSEFASVFGSNSSNADYVTKLYSNVLGRQPDIAGAHYWTEQLNSGAKARDVVLVGFAEGTENVTNTAPHMNNGYWIL